MKKRVIVLVIIVAVIISASTLIQLNRTSLGLFKSEFAKEDSEVVLTDFGTIFFLTDDGRAYGIGENPELGLNQYKYEEKAVRIPIEEKIIKIFPVKRTVFFFTETGDIYQTGKAKYFDYVAEEGEFLTDTPKQINLSQIPERVVGIAEFQNEEGCYFVTNVGKVYVLDAERKYEPIYFPEKIVSAYTTDNGGWFLSETKKLYLIGGLNPDIAVSDPTVKAENVEEVAVCGGEAVYYLSETGKVYAAGRTTNQLGINYNIYPEPETVDSEGRSWVNDFHEVPLMEKVRFVLEFDRCKGLVGESGRIHLIGDTTRYCPKGIMGDREYSDGDYYQGVIISNIEDVEKMISSWTISRGYRDIPLGKYAYAIKRVGKPWEICFGIDIGEYKAGQCVPLYELPEWQ